MRFAILILGALMLGIVVLAACNSREANSSGSAQVSSYPQPPQAAQAPGDNVRRVTAQELHDALEQGTAIVIDTRNEAAFKESHIKGARLIPANEVLQHADELPRDKLIVAYCT